VLREPNPRDGRGTLAVITESGRSVVDRATRQLHRNAFGLQGLRPQELRQLFSILRRLRVDAGDFVD
jgi:DNA-binding MarR family transcriptional regulator